MATIEDLATIKFTESNEDDSAEQRLLQIIGNKFQQKSRIYSRIGTRDLLVLNPGEHLPIYDQSVMGQYLPEQQNGQSHIFGVASQAMKAIIGDGTSKKNEVAIVFGGEAGSGKSENLFHALRYFAFIEEQRNNVSNIQSPKFDVELANSLHQLLNAFGGAKTLKNDNSTRHGYSIELQYFGSALNGIEIDSNVPLELSRLIQQKKGERNFGCFYQFCSGLSPEQREKFGIKSANNYFYLNQGKCPGLDSNKEAENFVHLCKALSRIGFSEHQQELIFRLLAAILHAGNVFFRAKKVLETLKTKIPFEKVAENDEFEEEYAELANEGEVNWIAHLMDIDFGNLKQILTKSSQGDPFTVDAALDRRDWFAKCIYAELFRWILSRINSFLRCPTNENLPKSKIMLVDLPGYERYNNNGHEEFCINLVSEQMERFFQEQIFGQFNDEELQNECPELGQSKWPSNSRIMEMLTKRPTGILALLDDECKFPKGSDETFLQHCNINHLDKCSIYSKARMKGKLEMGIRHHFGMAFYSIDGFLQKNYFLRVAAFYQILAKSKDAGLAAIFSQSAERQRENKWIYVANEWWKAIQKLSDQLANTNSIHFVRCIRTNYERIPGKWDPNAVLKQIKALNLLEHCRAVQMAFPHKFSLPFFVRQFKSLLPEDVIRGQSTQQIAKDILMAQGIRFEHDFVLGPQSIFLRDCLFGQLKEMQKFTQNFAAIVLQRNVRKFILRRAFLLKKAAIIRIQAGYRGWKGRKRVAEMRERQNWMNKFDQQKCEKKIGNENEGIGRGKKATNISEVALRDFPEELRKIIEKIGNENSGEEQQFRQSAKYISPPKANIQRPMVPPIKLEHFAMEHFKSIILGCRRDPIETPFLPKESEDEFNKSLELFKLILHYQFQPEGTNSGQLAALAKNIVQQGIDYPLLRDELFAQMLNQTHNCICEYALNRIWTLISIAVYAFPPSGLIFPVLYNQFQCQPAQFSRILMSGLLKVSALPETASPNRTFAPSIIEQESFIRRQPILLSTQFADGESINVEANSWTTTDEFVQTALRQRGIGDEFGWGLGIDDGIKCAELAATQFPFDAIASLENRRIDEEICTEMQEPFAIFDSPKCANKIGQNENGFGKKLENGILTKENEEMEKGNNFTQNDISNVKSTENSSNTFYRPSFLPPHQMPSRNRNFEFMANPSGQFGHSASQFSPHSSALPFVRHRLDIGGGLQFRRQANPNCMSRITEKDETESTVSTVNRHNTNRANIYADQNCLNAIERIKNGQIPKDGQNIEHQYFENSFEQGIPVADYGEESASAGEKFDRAIVGRLTASIKGGDFYGQALPQNQNQIGDGGGGRRQNPLFVPSRTQQNNQNEAYHSVEPPVRRFVYRRGDIMLDNGRQQIPFEPSQPSQTMNQRPFVSEQIGHKYVPLPPPPQYQPNGEFISPPAFSPTTQTFDQFYGHEKFEQNEPIENGQPTGLRRFIVRNGHSVASNQEHRGLNGIQEHKFEPSEKYQEILNQREENEMEEELKSGGGYEGIGYKREETDSILPTAGNEWMPESEATLDALFNGQQINGHQNNYIYSNSVRPKSNCGSENCFGTDQISGNKRKGNKKAALAYVNQPFQLNVRKQILLPEEILDDALEIDLIFAQIISDCRHRFNQMRIRKYEKESVNQLLRSYNVPPVSLNSPSQISSNIKLELIEIVRKWPLYFCRLFPCIEERPNGDRVPLFLGIGETGIRLISITIGGSRNAGIGEGGQQQQMTIQDHFEFSDIADILMERNGKGMRLITRQHIGILLIGTNLAEAKKCIQQYLGMGPKRRQFVIATAEYRTNEQNVLSFEIGDYIQLLDKPDCEPPQSAGTWLYGRLDGRFGWLPGEYVLDANSQEEQLYSASCTGPMSESGLTFPCDSIANNSTSFPTIPGVLEPLFTNLDPSALFMPDHMGVERYSMVEFAVRFFRRPKGNPTEKKFNKDFYVGDWSWKEVTDRVKFTDKPIGHSLLRLESHEADKVGQQTFLCIMRFMGDESLKRNQSYTDCVYELLSLCHIYVLIRDEVYCQLLKQITANRSEKNSESGLRGWRLLSILCAYFPCSETLKPFLVKYLGDVAFDLRRTYNALAKLCLFNLAQTYRFGGRRLILGAAEVEAIANGRSVRRQWYNLPGGHRRQICTRSVMVAEEIVQALCLEMNIRGQAEQQEFTLCYLIEKDNSVCTLLNDEYVMDVCTDLETRGDEYLLILMRSVWLHPLRRDSELYTDALFFQMMPNYLTGLYATLREDGSATAATLNDIATLGALLLLSDPFQRHENAENISPTNLAAFVPKTVLQFAGLSIEQWAQRIRGKMGELVQHQGNSPIGARQRFLEIVERWPLFGAAFYFVKRVFSGKDGNNPPLIGEKVFGQNCILAFNKFGIRILTDEMHQIMAEFALEGIREMAKYSVAEANFLEIRFSATGAQKHGIDSITVETDLGNEISRLIGHYIFLSKKQ